MKETTKMKGFNDIYSLVVSAEQVDEEFIWKVCDGTQQFQVNGNRSINEEIKVNDLVVVRNPYIFFNFILLKGKTVMTKVDEPERRERMVETIKSSNSLKEQITAINPTFF